MDRADDKDITSRIILDRDIEREQIERFDKQLFPKKKTTMFVKMYLLKKLQKVLLLDIQEFLMRMEYAL